QGHLAVGSATQSSASSRSARRKGRHPRVLPARTRSQQGTDRLCRTSRAHDEDRVRLPGRHCPRSTCGNTRERPRATATVRRSPRRSSNRAEELQANTPGGSCAASSLPLRSCLGPREEPPETSPGTGCDSERCQACASERAFRCYERPPPTKSPKCPREV